MAGFIEGNAQLRGLHSFEVYVDYAKLSPEDRDLLERSGKFWREARQETGLSRQEMARRLGMDEAKRQELALFENGLVAPEIYRGFLPRTYAEILGKPELYDRFCREFNIPPVSPRAA